VGAPRREAQFGVPGELDGHRWTSFGVAHDRQFTVRGAGPGAQDCPRARGSDTPPEGADVNPVGNRPVMSDEAPSRKTVRTRDGTGVLK
jgi:hypothetical protein